MAEQDTISGVFPAVATPLDGTGQPDIPLLAAHCRHLLAQGAAGLAILGSTGEANSLSVAERQGIVDGLVAAGIPAGRLLPGAGLCSVPETLALLRHGLDNGVRRFLLLPPFYYKALSDDGLFAYFARLMDGLGDDRLRIVLYHFPALSGVPVPSAVVGRLRQAFPGVFAGMKDSSADPAHSIAMFRQHPGFSLLVGADQTMLEVLRAGGAGCITALTNLTVPEMSFIFRHHGDSSRADDVQRVQRRIEALRKLSSTGVQLANIKAMLALTTGNPAWAVPRVPFLPADAAQVAHLRAEMARIDRELPFGIPA
jgi:4-hydroxy-tetrahydrodipicolinate synthase